jgi:hypothetical protein
VRGNIHDKIVIDVADGRDVGVCIRENVYQDEREVKDDTRSVSGSTGVVLSFTPWLELGALVYEDANNRFNG